MKNKNKSYTVLEIVSSEEASQEEPPQNSSPFKRNLTNQTSNGLWGSKKRKMHDSENIEFEPELNLKDSSEIIYFDSGKSKEGNSLERPLQICKNKVCPWLTKKTKDIKDTLLRFHNEIIDFYHYVSPTNNEHQKKVSAYIELKNLILKAIPQAKVTTFGSFETRLYLPDGDIDIAVLTDDNPDLDDRDAYDKIYREILKQGNTYSDVEYIRKSKVPLIKLIHTEQQIPIDISVNKRDGLEQLVHVDRMIENYPEFKYLVFVLKCSLKVRGLGETYTGGLGSFLLFCMLFVYLREMQVRRKYYTLSEHVMRFLQFYSLQNEWSKKIIYVKTGFIADRRDDGCLFSVMSPQDQEHDIGRSAFKIRDVFNLFKNRFRLIIGKNFQAGESVLKEMVNPNQQEFKYIKQ